MTSLIAVCACGPTSRTSDSPPISLNLLAPASVLSDSNAARLRVFQATDVACNGPDLASPAPSVSVLDLDLARCSDGVRWCGTGTLTEDATDSLTWYVEGTYATGQPAFRGCTTEAVAQNPAQVSISVVAVLPGSRCGDGVVMPPETCDPGAGGATDEACDATTCQTKEVIVSKGVATNQFYRGLALGRKSDVSLGFFGDGHVFEVWSDSATQNAGGDGPPQLTVRRLTDSLTTDSSGVTVLLNELRMQTDVGFSATGLPLRNGKCTSASLAPLDSATMLATFAWTQPGLKPRVFVSTQRRNLGTAASPDAPLTAASVGSSQDQPATTAGSDGSVLIAFIQDGATVATVRHSDGSIAQLQTLSAAGATTSRPRVASRPGGYVVAWSDGKDVQLRLLGLDGIPVGPQTTVNANHAGVCDQPDVAVASNGTILVTYRDAAGEVGADIRVQKLDATGALTGTEAQTVLNDLVKAGDQSAPAVATGIDGYGKAFFIVVWVDPSRPQLAGRIVAAEAPGYENNPIDGSTDEFPIGVAAGPRSSPAVAVVGTSPAACAVSWVDETSGDPSANDDRVRVRRIPVPPKLD
ncbi:MAG: hypothetical protein ACHREM_29760 [Polyangiales bacterium]